MAEIVGIKLEPLDSEAFKPFGRVLESKQPIFPEVEPGEGLVAMEMVRNKRPNPPRLEELAVHFSYNQTFIPLEGALALIVAPAPDNREAGQQNYQLDYKQLRAFLINPGEAAIIDKGVWHNALPLGEECKLINVTRKNPGEGTTVQPGPGRIPHATREYIEMVNLKERDNRILELML